MQIIDFYFYEFEYMFIITIIIMAVGLLKLICLGCESKYLRLILTLIFIFLSSYFINYTIKQPKTLIVKYINKNVDENEINISKEQIINDILSGKITQNKNNLKIYTQSIPITKEEYKKLSKYKEEYDKKTNNGNINIIN